MVNVTFLSVFVEYCASGLSGLMTARWAHSVPAARMHAAAANTVFR